MVLTAPRRRDTARVDPRLPDLLQHARQGDEHAWQEIVSRYAGLVWSAARAHRLSEADAADVAQATWIALVQHLGDIKEPAAVGGWLATTARRECLRSLRKTERVEPCAEVPETADDAEEVCAGLLRSERDAALWRAFARLGPRDQALLRMLAADPAPTYVEIGAALDMPIGSIGPTRARALERLRRELER